MTVFYVDSESAVKNQRIFQPKYSKFIIVGTCIAFGLSLEMPAELAATGVAVFTTTYASIQAFCQEASGYGPRLVAQERRPSEVVVVP